MELCDVKVVKSDRRSFCLEISPSLDVILRAPRYASKAKIEAFFDSKRAWLDEHLAVMEKRVSEAKKRERLTDEELEALVKRAKQVIPERVRYFAGTMGVSYGKVTVRKQKTRWGSCSSKKNLSFNCLLLLLDGELLDYVVVHELCHLRHMNHSPSFWDEVKKYMPDFEARRARLKKCRTDM